MNPVSSFVIASLLAVAPIVADMPAENDFSTLARIYTEKLAKGAEVVNDSDGRIIYNLIPNAAAQGWTLAVNDLTAEPAHYHNLQPQVLVVLEGLLKQTIDGCETVYFAGQHVVLPTGALHSQEPVDGLCRVIEVDFEDRTFPETFPPIDLAYTVNARSTDKYSFYDLAPAGTVEGNPWSAALIEIYDTPTHYHLIGKEIVIVVNGELEITIEDEIYHLTPGQVIHIPPTKKHKLKSASASEGPVRVLLVAFPAYDRRDSHIVN